MVSLEQVVHIIPLGYEFDRAVKPFEGKDGLKTNRVYLLSSIETGIPALVKARHEKYLKKVSGKFADLGIEVSIIAVNLINLPDVLKKISYLIQLETSQGNHVYVNMSAAGRMTSVGATLAGMVHGARVYYVESDDYSASSEDWELHGLTIVGMPRVQYLENFQIALPDNTQKKVLVELYKKKRLRTRHIIKFLSDIHVDGFQNNYEELNRDEKTKVIMKLNRGIMDKLEKLGYVEKEKVGRETEYRLSGTGVYIACISGLIDK